VVVLVMVATIGWETKRRGTAHDHMATSDRHLLLAPALLLLLLLLHTPRGACQLAGQSAPASSSAVVELTLSSVEPALNVLQFRQDIALVCDVNMTRVRVVGVPAPDIATGTTTVVTEITAPADGTVRSAISALERLLEMVNAMGVSAAGTTVLQFGAQVIQRPASTGSSVPPAMDREEDSSLTALQVSLIAGSSFCGLVRITNKWRSPCPTCHAENVLPSNLAPAPFVRRGTRSSPQRAQLRRGPQGFAAGVAALTWRHWRQHTQVKVAQF
jgi:hypothetical protein